MIDTHARKWADPVIDKTADWFLNRRWTANQVTVLAFGIGVLTGPLIYFDAAWAAFICLWISGFLDTVDGAMARKTRPSAFGTVLDITFDRLVEASVLLGLAFRYPDLMWLLLLLSVSILFSITVFLTVGNMSEQSGVKSFYYQAGLAERTEGFILFSLMMLFPAFLLYSTALFLFVETFTGLQRLLEAKRLLKEQDENAAD
ncbi:CDP-alcohol phosphatidyltransferase family protein [Marinococcus halotolerans]|uniref:CDP-alcohol phosphatidyltransferase family protein n=1 Tax=Marinococcus halotolerans TaxID=301092 RepID=UPI0003B49EF4|nr:CDP-alcohol phosphatidyltransferase family protein [Marinococcus halotolerans]